MMNLFEECVHALGQDAYICEERISKKILIDFEKCFPLTVWGRIDWGKIKIRKKITSVENIIFFLIHKKKDPYLPVYVIWSDPTVPILVSRLDRLLALFDDVEAVSPNVWFYCPVNGWIVEVYHDGEVTIGLLVG